MRILHVIQRYWPYVGGSERYFQEISERLVADGHTVDVFTTDAWDLEYFWDRRKRRVDKEIEIKNGVTIRRYPVKHWPLSRKLSPPLRRVMTWISTLPSSEAALWQLANLTPWVPGLQRALNGTATAYDLVHAANIPFDSIVGAAQNLAQRQNIPFILTPFIHLGENGSSPVRKYYTMRHQLDLIVRSDCIFVQTPRERNFLAEQGVSQAQIKLLGMGVTPADVTGGDAQRIRRTLDINGPVILFIGVLAHDKGAVHLIEAMKPLWEEGCSATLVLAGPKMEHFSTYFAKQPAFVRQHCRLPGVVTGDDKRDLFAAATVFAMPSRTDAFGIVYLEAWSCGLPVIGARAGGTPDVIDDTRDGFIVPFGDMEALRNRILTLLRDTSLAKRMGAQGREKVLKRYTWDRVYADVRATYRRLTNQGAYA